MHVYEMVVVPTPQTLTHIRNVFSGCPFEVDFDSLHVSLNFSSEEGKPDPDAMYAAQSGHLGLWYDPVLGASSLILPLYSEGMSLRAQDLREDAPSLFYGALYFPHMVLVDRMPPMRRYIKSFVNSMERVLNSVDGTPLTFGPEAQLSYTTTGIPASEFYKAMERDYEYGRPR